MTTAPPPPVRWPEDNRALLPFVPMIYVAWADGALSADQLRHIRQRLEQHDAFDESCRAVVRAWLDPDDPPTPPALHDLLAVVRRHAPDLPTDERFTLAELGLSLVPPAASDPTDSTGTLRALRDVEEALGIAGTEVSRELLAEEPSPSPAEPAEPVLDVAALRAVLDTPGSVTRQRVREVLADPVFAYQHGLSTAAYRKLVLEWTQRLADAGLGAVGYPEAVGGGGDFEAFMHVFETLGYHDLSLVVKFGVQFGLFGGSVFFLGTKRHHQRLLPKIGSLRVPGCFAMSELGHGSNVWDLETVARYDADTEEFVITTPHESARKEWIGNAAVHGRLATVFAQLQVGGERFGVHAFVVPIRNGRGRLMPGVRIEDCGEKEGLNGVDNGRLWFDDVRVPRRNLLNRFGDVTPDGTYQSAISSPSKRFFTMLGTLVGGRVSVAAAGLSAAKTGLAIAIRYGTRRRQFGPAGRPEIPIADYVAWQRRVMPRLATVYALDFAQKYVARRYHERTDDDGREVEGLAAGLKAYSSWNTVETLQVAREACGGQGYLAVNRIPQLKADADIFTTFEGDNTVLMQLVAKGCLTNYRDQFGEMRFWGIVKFVADRAATAITQLNPVITRNTDESHLRDPDFQLAAFRYREERLLATAARRLKARIDDGMDTFEAFNACQDHLVSMAHAYVERIVLEQFTAGVRRQEGTTVEEPLRLLRDLYALWRMEQDRGWFLENGYIESGKAKAIRRLVIRLCAEVRAMAIPLVHAFGIPDAVLGAPIAFSIDPTHGPGSAA